MFLIAFAILTPSYFLLGQVHQFWPFFLVYMLVALGAAIFKPLVVGTVARSANEHNRGRAFGIFYMMVNVGGFLVCPSPICYLTIYQLGTCDIDDGD